MLFWRVLASKRGDYLLTTCTTLPLPRTVRAAAKNGGGREESGRGRALAGMVATFLMYLTRSIESSFSVRVPVLGVFPLPVIPQITVQSNLPSLRPPAHVWVPCHAPRLLLLLLTTVAALLTTAITAIAAITAITAIAAITVITVITAPGTQ